MVEVYQKMPRGSIVIKCPPVGMEVTKKEAEIIKELLENLLKE